MSTGAVIACTEQGLAAQLRELLGELGDIEVLAVAESTSELETAVLEREPTIVVVHEDLGPAPVHPVVRDLSLRRPGSVVVMLTDGSAASITAAMIAGARSVLELPLTFDEMQRSVQGAIDWARQIESLLAGGGGSDAGPSRSRVLTVTGGKGGVGTTTVATHLAWQHVRSSEDKTLLIDLDLEKGDVSSFVDVKYRISIADLAKVAGDLSVRTVLDGTLEHESGMFLLLPPEDIRDVEWVTPQAFREILSLLRGEFDHIVIDAGSHVTPLQAAAVESADDVVTVVTPDLAAIRGARRSVAAWESLGARKSTEVRVLVNRQSRDRELQPRSIAQLVASPLLTATIPESLRALEASVNSRSPELVNHQPWWKAVRALGEEVHLDEPESKSRRRAGSQGNDANASQPEGQVPLPAEEGVLVGEPAGRPARRRARRDEGAASIELLGVLPVLILLSVLTWQLVMAGMTWIWTGQAAADAAREVSLGSTETTVRAAAEDRLPSQLSSSAQVAVTGTRTVAVSVKVPLVAPGIAELPWRVNVERTVVREP